MRACTIYAGRVSHWNLRGGTSYRRLQHTTAASGNTRFLFQNKNTMMKRSGTGGKWKEDRNKKATRVGALTNSARERHTREADKHWTINRNDERIERENEPGSSNYDLERSGCNEGKDGSRRRPMKGTALHWQNNQLSRKVSKATGIRSTVSPRFESRFLRSVSAGYPTEETERGTKSTTERERKREWESEMRKGSRLLYPNSWKSFPFWTIKRPPSLSFIVTPLRSPTNSATMRPFRQGNWFVFRTLRDYDGPRI